MAKEATTDQSDGKITADVYLEFVENHLPPLKAGTYQFSGKQNLVGPGIGDGTNGFEIPIPNFQVKVEGERFHIHPAEVVTVFPPRNSLGHYANVLPHIAFKRDTLPWERSISTGADRGIPWLALLVLSSDELMTDDGNPPGNVKEQQQAEDGYVKKDFKSKPGDKEPQPFKGAGWPPDKDVDEQIKVIYVKKSTLQSLLPSDKDLTWLAHARKSRIGLKGVNKGDHIEVFKDSNNSTSSKSVLIHQEAAPHEDCSIDCGRLEAGEYTIEVAGKKIAKQPLTLKPSDQVGGETAIVVANRLPKSGEKSIVHLVSLEDRYQKKGSDYAFDCGNADAVPLASLHSWSFTALTEKETFRHILLHLNHEFLFGIDGEKLQAPLDIGDLKPGFLVGGNPLGDHADITDRAVQKHSDNDHAYFKGKSGTIYNAGGRKALITNGAASKLKWEDVNSQQLWVTDGPRTYFVSEDRTRRLLVYLLPTDDTPSLRLPSREGKNSSIANHFLQQGYVPLPHHFRRGGKSVSWYRGPLLAGKPVQKMSDDRFPVHTADELLRYDKNCGMFDTSYAAAWELGRLLCLRNKRVSVELYRWKRSHVRQLKAMAQQHLHPHLPFHTDAPGKIVLPEKVEMWFSDISLLKGLPFSYLLPDERMLTPESLCFFYLDPSWIASLVDGAFSIGRVDRQHDNSVDKQACLTDLGNVDRSEIVTGFLLRSSVVKGWPNLQVNAYDSSDASKNSEMPCLRLSHLADNVLLGLFRGEMKCLDIHENPETIHCGFPLPKKNGQEYKKSINGSVIKVDKLSRVMDLSVLTTSKTFTSAQFARCLVEGVSRVRFIKSKAVKSG